MPFDSSKSKAIQIARVTDDKLEVVRQVIKDKELISLGSRDKIIDMLASRFLAENK